MIARTEIIFLIELCLIFIVFSSPDKECDKTKCKGPLAFYEDLRCKPIYKNPGDCCAEKYDCTHLKERSPKKCYINDNVYEIGDKLKDEDALPCDIGCTCIEGFQGFAEFNCAIVDCFQRPKPGCKTVHYSNQCCPSVVCPDDGELATCVVDGKTYYDGDDFVPKGEPEKKCTCQPGYEGENVDPFCHVQSKSSYCRVELKHSTDIQQKCVPVYYNEQSPQTDCSVFYRCQNDNDTLIANNECTDSKNCSNDESATCIFGNIRMQIGDELNQATDYSSVCVQCKCEVPPVPTCQRLPDDECDVTKHPVFDNFN